MKPAAALATIFALAIVAPASAAAPQAVWTVDPVHSSATFTATHLMISHVSGTIPIVNASVTVPVGAKIPIAVQAQLDPSGVDTRVSQRDSDLRSPHFFDVQTYPAMTFQSTAITATDATHFTVTGNLTLHGVTKPVTLTAQYLGEGPGMRPGERRIAYMADGTINRSDFGMSYMNPVVSDSIAMHLEIEAYLRQ